MFGNRLALLRQSELQGHPNGVIRARRGSTTAFYEFHDEIPVLELVDSVAGLCSATQCAQQLPSGELLYIDQFHLSAAGGRYFARASGLVELIERELAATPTTH
jgi:hypothetical protein